MKLTLAFLLAAACAAAAEEKVVLHMYDVSALTMKITMHKGPALGFDGLGVRDGSDMGGIGIGTMGGEEEGTAIPGEDLKLIITQDVAPGTWDTPPHSIEYQNGSLFVVHTPAVQEAVKKFLDIVRNHLCKNVIVEAEVFELAPGILDSPAGTVLSEAQVKAIDDAAGDPAKGRRVASLRASGLNTQRFHASALAEESYLRDFDIEIAQKQAIAKPVIADLRTGFDLDVLPVLSPDAGLVLLTARFSSCEFLGMRSFIPGTQWLGTIEEPDVAAARTRTSIVLPVGKTAVLSAAAYAAAGNGWSQVVLVRPSVAADPPLPYPPSGKPTELRMFDVRAILYRPPSFYGPRLGGIRAGKDSAPTTSFAPPEEENGVLLSAEQLETLIKQNVAQSSWTEHEGEVSIALTGDQQLLVVQTPEVLAQIEALLGRLMVARSRIVSVDSWVLALDPASWSSRREALSGDITDAAWTDLLALAAQGTGARIAGTARAAGLNGSRFHTARGVIRSLVMDYNVEIADSASALDPVVASIAEGVSLDVTGSSVADSGQVQLDLRPTVVLGGEPQAFTLKEKGAQVQATSLSDFGVRTQMLVDAGRPALVGIATREDGGKTEVLLLFVKATVTDVK